MFHNDHLPPHFHAKYREQQMVVAFDTLAVVARGSCARATGLVMEWAAEHQNELRHVWEQSRRQESLDRIDPLP